MHDLLLQRRELAQRAHEQIAPAPRKPQGARQPIVEFSRASQIVDVAASAEERRRNAQVIAGGVLMGAVKVIWHGGQS